VPKKEKMTVAPLRVVPTRLVDGPGGGGGNPNIQPSNAQQKGDTLVPQPPKAATPPAQPQKKPQKNPVKAPERVTSPKNTASKSDKSDKDAPLVLKPSKHANAAKARARQEEAEAKAAAAQAQAFAAATRGVAERIGSATEALTTGFAQGTAVEVWGPGGEATADYAAFVEAIYRDAWIVPNDLIDDDATAKVSITIARSGRVISARIVRRSGNLSLDRSVQRTLDKVKFVHEFPEGARDEERTYYINFNLNAKRSIG
jgi:protein TonB